MLDIWENYDRPKVCLTRGGVFSVIKLRQYLSMDFVLTILPLLQEDKFIINPYLSCTYCDVGLSLVTT